MNRPGLVKASTLEPFTRFLAANGVILIPHFLKANIPPDLIAQNDAWLPKQQVYSFLTDVAATCEMESLGLVVGDQICVADLGDLAAEIYTCDTLGAACLRFTELVPRFAEGNTASVKTFGPETWLTYRTTDHRKGNRDDADHYGMMMLLGLVRLVAGRWYPENVTIQTGPCEAFAGHPAWRHTRVEFNAYATGFAFPSAWLDRLIPTPPEDLEISTTTGAYVSNPPETLARSLEIILGAYLRIGGIPSIKMVAESLNMSERTLKRRLADEGDSYSDLTDRVRGRTAERLLRESDSTVKEIAYALGYSGPNNFIRAFQRLSGCTPGEYRQRNIETGT